MRTLGLTGLGQGRSIVPDSSLAVLASSMEKGKGRRRWESGVSMEQRGEGNVLQHWFGVPTEKEGGGGGGGGGGSQRGGGTKTNCTMSHLPNFDKTKIIFPFFL